MAGRGQNEEFGEQGKQVVLDVKFFKRGGGLEPADDDDFPNTGKLPIVKIYDPDGALVADSAPMGNPSPIRINKGDYEYTYSIPAAAVISDKWKIIWTIDINGTTHNFEELFKVIAPTGAEAEADFGNDEYRTGFAFQNPDLSSTHYFDTWTENLDKEFKAFGHIIHPDELRYMVGFGNKLVSPDASQTYDDNMLQWYIDQAIAMIERDLDIDLLPRVIRHEDPVATEVSGSAFSSGSLVGEDSIVRTQGDRVARVDIPEGESNVREPGYPYRRNPANYYLWTKLRRRPVRDILKAVMADPVLHTTIDIYDWRRPKIGFDGTIQFVPNFTSIANSPFAASTLMTSRYPFPNLPDTINIDYRTGYENARKVPMEFRSVLLWVAGIMLMEDFSDGRAPGIASASVNLNSISESFATTQSATNSLLGARIAYYKEHVKKWMDRNKFKYNRNLVGVL